MNQIKWRIGMVVTIFVGLACLAQADAKDDAKERRKARREQIAQIVQAGQAEEGNDGYLAAKATLDNSKDTIVKAENADRRIGYEAIAKANGKSVAEIGSQAAIAIKKRRESKK